MIELKVLNFIEISNTTETDKFVKNTFARVFKPKMILHEFFKFIFSARVPLSYLKKKKFSLIFRNYFSLGLIGFPSIFLRFGFRLSWISLVSVLGVYFL
ncbi:hypothetical protein LEP1GSC018_0562 [Leptospira kirschneri str. 2008720114]|nr:hypothetical protein LEP1GSC082_1894 [Leptospira kirschneri str. H2]EKP03868.1 hypothetical protein LEP1GSC018_0562 [Leptospira kirschneri str. 2008720114]EMJ92282.1 hypothetical protein LEP1GSC198_0652 [Leptospira kirschneri str. JB]